MSKRRHIYHNALVHFKTDLGNAFRNLREERGLTLKDLQEKTGVYNLHLLELLEEGKAKQLFIYFRLCCFYGKRPLISFIDLPEEENLYLQMEKDRCAKP